MFCILEFCASNLRNFDIQSILKVEVEQKNISQITYLVKILKPVKLVLEMLKLQMLAIMNMKSHTPFHI